MVGAVVWSDLRKAPTDQGMQARLEAERVREQTFPRTIHPELSMQQPSVQCLELSPVRWMLDFGLPVP